MQRSLSLTPSQTMRCWDILLLIRLTSISALSIYMHAINAALLSSSACLSLLRLTKNRAESSSGIATLRHKLID
ncbi:hypothetical protein BD769DRAFT_1547437 [Suillus cothurnatus]|nr:hypothetical protein BD769DRAFT_1547437 [Suillus cothurnatus]